MSPGGVRVPVVLATVRVSVLHPWNGDNTAAFTRKLAAMLGPTSGVRSSDIGLSVTAGSGTRVQLDVRIAIRSGGEAAARAALSVLEAATLSTLTASLGLTVRSTLTPTLAFEALYPPSPASPPRVAPPLPPPFMAALSDAVGIAAAAVVAAALCALGVALGLAQFLGSRWRRRTTGLRLLGQPDRSHKFGIAPEGQGSGGGAGVGAATATAGAANIRRDDGEEGRPEAVVVELTAAAGFDRNDDAAEGSDEGVGHGEGEEYEATDQVGEYGGDEDADKATSAGLPKGTKSNKMRRAREANTAARRERASTVGK